MTTKIVFYTEDQTGNEFDYIMEICYTMTKLEISNLKDRFLSASRSRNRYEDENAAAKIAIVRGIIDYLFETRKIDHHIMGELHTLSAKVMGINKVSND